MVKRKPSHPVMNPRLIFAIVILALLAGFLPWPVKSAPVFLGPIAYKSFADSPFKSRNFDYFHLEDFEDGALNMPGVTAPSGGVTSPGPIPILLMPMMD